MPLLTAWPRTAAQSEPVHQRSAASSDTPRILAAGVVPGAADPLALSPDDPADSSDTDTDHSETAWRLRHLRRSILKEAERIAQEIISGAKANMDAELLKAKDALRREAALMALELAEKLVKEQISKEDQARILEEYIEKVGGR